MRTMKKITSAFVAVGAVAFLAGAMLSFTAPSANATPAIAKGKPCTTCHAGSPPSKSNLNDAGKAAMPK